VLAEAFRVLKPGGRFAVSDVVTRVRSMPRSARTCCYGWAAWRGLDENEYRAKLAAAGFQAYEVEPTRIYRAEDATSFLADKGLDMEEIARRWTESS